MGRGVSGYPIRRQYPFWDVCFDGALEHDNLEAHPDDGGAEGEEEMERWGPDWFWGSCYPKTPWTASVIPDGLTGGGGGNCSGNGGSGSSDDEASRCSKGGDERFKKQSGVFVHMTVPAGSVGVLQARAASIMDVLSGRSSV